jgi:hypothetical protein
MNAKKVFWVVAGIALAAVLCKAFLPEWIVSGFHVGR